MQTWRTPGWFLPVALAAGILGIAVTNALVLRHKAMPASAVATIPERIGLTARHDGDAIQLQWDRRSSPVLNADRAIVHIHDGKYQSQLDLTDQQLSSASVRYWPESPAVTFRMEVYHGTASTSDTVQIAVTESSRAPLGRATARSIVEKVSPSPFVRVRPQIVRSPSARRTPSVPVANSLVSPRQPQPEPVPRSVAGHRESGLSRVVSKIPLLRRLKKHPQSADLERSADNNPRP